MCVSDLLNQALISSLSSGSTLLIDVLEVLCSLLQFELLNVNISSVFLYLNMFPFSQTNSPDGVL